MDDIIQHTGTRQSEFPLLMLGEDSEGGEGGRGGVLRSKGVELLNVFCMWTFSFPKDEIEGSLYGDTTLSR